MAKVHKAHKSSKKYGFQKKKVNVKALLIVLAVVVVAAIGLKIAYDNYVYDEFDVSAPSNEQLNNIAANWELLNADLDNFYNYYDYYNSMLGYTTDGTDGNGNVLLLYTGNENVEEVSIQINTTALPSEDAVVESFGALGRTTLTNFINGVAPWGQTTIQLSAYNDICSISVYDADAEEVDPALLNEIIAEIEAIIARGPVETEEVVEETTETTETTEESTEAAE